MKIMQVIPYFCFGGAETMCENLAYALKQMGHEVVVVSLYNERTPIARRMEENGVRILYLDKKLGLDVSMVPKLCKLMKQERPDAVHTHLNVIKYAVLAAKLAGVRHCVHTVHNVADREAEGGAQKFINKTYFSLGWSRPVALSGLVQKTIEEFYGLPESKVPVVYNGIDLSRCIPRECYKKGLTFLHIGRFNEQKNHEGMLRIFKRLHDSRPDCRLQLLGDGELWEDMRALVKELGMENCVEFCGAQGDVYPYLNRADVFILPSRYEGMPMTLIEAMGTALPIAATAVGGVPDMLENEVSALLTGQEADEILASWERLAEDAALRRRLGENARRASVRFSAETMAEQYLKLYER